MPLSGAVETPLLAVKGRIYAHNAKGTPTNVQGTPMPVEWEYLHLASLEQISTLAPGDVRTLVCVREEIDQEGCYTSTGGVSYSPAGCALAPSANRRQWDVLMLRLSDKRVIASTHLRGGDPPKTLVIKKDPYSVYIPGTGGATGDEPIIDLVKWINDKRSKP